MHEFKLYGTDTIKVKAGKMKGNFYRVVTKKHASDFISGMQTDEIQSY